MKPSNNQLYQLKMALGSLKMTKKKLFIIMGIVTAVIIAIAFYLGLVPVNFNYGGFRTLLTVLLFFLSSP